MPHSKRKTKARNMQPFTEGGRVVLVAFSVMPSHGFPSHCGAGCPVMGLLSLAHEIDVVTLHWELWGITPVLWGLTPQADGISRGELQRTGSHDLFHQGSSNNWSGSLSTSAQSLTLGWGKHFKFQAFLAEVLFILFFSLCRKCEYLPAPFPQRLGGLACFTYTGIYFSSQMNRGWLFFQPTLWGQNNVKRKRKERRKDK